MENSKELFDLNNLSKDEYLLYLLKKFEEIVKIGNEEEIKEYEIKINALIGELKIDESTIQTN